MDNFSSSNPKDPKEPKLRLVIISGRSGSGKTVALHALEDLGFYCIDNLPFHFLPELEKQIAQLHPSIAVSLDARNLPEDWGQFKTFVEYLKSDGRQCDILYLDADDNTLLKRYSETRRKHPLTDEKTSLREAIRKEHALLAPIANLADLNLDTQHLARQDLHRLIRERIAPQGESQIQVLLQSFGFKHGLPPDADFVFDVRCLPNPYWQHDLRPLTGLDVPVIEFLESQDTVQDMVQEIHQFLENWIPRFEADNRSYLTIAIGCTGGKHRSVYLVEQLSGKLQGINSKPQIRHRDVHKV